METNFKGTLISVFLLFDLNSSNSLIILKTWDLPFFGGMYNSTLSENKINPTLSLFLVAENAKVAANSVTYSFLKAVNKL